MPNSDCGPNDLRVQIGYAGICGTDIHGYLAGPIFPPKPGETHPYSGAELPVILGHEMAGTIIEVGSEVKTVSVGQRVAIIPAMDERHYGLEPCNMCQRGRRNICKRTAYRGLNAPGGGFANEAVVTEHDILLLLDDISLQLGALLEPLAVAWHMVRTAGMQQGDNCVILGAGPIGLALLLVLKFRGAGKIIVSEVTASRAEIAKQFGADQVINPLAATNTSEDIVVSAAHDLMDDGADIAFDASGIQATFDTAIACTRPGGTIFNVAIHEKPLSIHLNDLTTLEKKLTGGICYTREDLEGALELVKADKTKVEKMITAVTPLEETVKGGFVELLENKGMHVKSLIEVKRE